MRKSSIFQRPAARRVLPAAAFAACLAWGAAPARATNYNWLDTTGTAPSDWNTPANWDNGVPQSSVDTTLQFGSGTYTSTDDLAATAFTLNGITLSGTTGAQTITGTAGDTLVFANSSAAAAPFISVNGGTTTTFNGFSGFTLGSGVVLNLNGTGAGQASFGVPFTGPGSIVANSTGAVTSQFSLTSANTFSGGLTLTNGRLALTAASTGSVGAVTGGSLGTGTFNWNGGYVRTSTGGTRTISNAVTIGGNIGLGDNVTASNASQTLVLNGATTLASTLSTYTLTVAASTATVAPVNFAGAIGETTAGTGITVAAAGTAGGTVTFSGAAANTYTGATTVGGTSANVSSVLQLNKTAGINAIAGNLNINQFGTVQLAASNQIADTSVLTLGTASVTGGTFDLNGNSETVNSVAAAVGGTITNSASGTASTLTLNNPTAGVNTVYGALTNGAGTLALVKNGMDTLVLGSSTSTYSGGTTLNTGGIAISNAAALGTGALTINGGIFRGTNAFVGTVSNPVSIAGNVILGSFTPATGTVTLSGATTLQGTGATRTLSIGGNVANSTPVIFGGAIGEPAGAGNGVNVALAPSNGNAGILTFNGNNTYTGPTNVNSGTLLINGNSSAATGNVTVASGATLGGSGTVGGATTVTGILSVGSVSTTPAILTFGGVGALTLQGTAAFDITGAGGAANQGIGYDTATVSGGSGLLTYKGGTLTVNLNGTSPAVGTTYKLFNFTSETETTAFSSIVVGGNSYPQSSFDYTTGTLTITAVPEPSTWVGAMLMLGLGAWGMRRKARAAARPAGV